MARIRSAKPDFWTDPLMCSLPRDIRFTYKGLWEVCADDDGRFLADSRVVKGAVWSMDDDISLKKIEKWLLELARVGRIQLYVVLGVRYGFIRSWQKHQRVSHPSPSRYPVPPIAEDSGAIPETLASDSVLSGAERIREEGSRSGAEEDSGTPPPPASPFPLPGNATALLNRYYMGRSESERDRYRDVRRQLELTIRDGVPGPKIRGGIRVKARSIEHLNDCCAAVLKDPPNDTDLAVLFVLKKLTDKPKGPSETELASDREKERIALDDKYHAAMKAAGLQWAKDHPLDYERIRSEVDAQFKNTLGSQVGRMARDSALAQRCGKAAGFPSFDQWSATA